jgi:hypothetical protein
MNEQQNKSEYLLLFRGIEWDRGLSAEQIQRVTGAFMAWFERLKLEGIAKTGQPLRSEGKVVSGPRGRSIADGPYAESKEAIGGYFLLEVADEAEAVRIAQECPILEFGAMVEVRPVAERCPMMDRAEEVKTYATA